jgi:hypothetical protein
VDKIYVDPDWVEVSNYKIISEIPEQLLEIDSWRIILQILRKYFISVKYGYDKICDDYETHHDVYSEYTSYIIKRLQIIKPQYESFIQLIKKIEDDNKSLSFWITEYDNFIKNPLIYNFHKNDTPEYHTISIIDSRYGGKTLSFGYGLNGFQHLILLEKWCDFMEAFKDNLNKMSDERIKNIIYYNALYKFMKDEVRIYEQDRVITNILIQRGLDKRLMNCLIYLFEAEMKCKMYRDKEYKRDYNFITLNHLCKMYKCYLKGTSINIYDVLKSLYKTMSLTRKSQFKRTIECNGFVLII